MHGFSKYARFRVFASENWGMAFLADRLSQTSSPNSKSLIESNTEDAEGKLLKLPTNLKSIFKTHNF